MMKLEESEMKMKLEEWKKTLPEKKQDVTDDKFLFGVPGVRSPNYFPLSLTKGQEEKIARAKEQGRHKFGTKGRCVVVNNEWKD